MNLRNFFPITILGIFFILGLSINSQAYSMDTKKTINTMDVLDPIETAKLLVKIESAFMISKSLAFDRDLRDAFTFLKEIEYEDHRNHVNTEHIKEKIATILTHFKEQHKRIKAAIKDVPFLTHEEKILTSLKKNPQFKHNKSYCKVCTHELKNFLALYNNYIKKGPSFHLKK